MIPLRLLNNLSEIVDFKYLPICLLGNLNAFLSSAVFFSKSTLSKMSFRNTFRVSNRLNLDQS